MQDGGHQGWMVGGLGGQKGLQGKGQKLEGESKGGRSRKRRVSGGCKSLGPKVEGLRNQEQDMR